MLENLEQVQEVLRMIGSYAIGIFIAWVFIKILQEIFTTEKPGDDDE